MIVLWLVIIALVLFIVCWINKNGLNFDQTNIYQGWLKPNCPTFVSDKDPQCSGVDIPYRDIDAENWANCKSSGGSDLAGYYYNFCQAGLSYDDMIKLSTQHGMWFYDGQPLYIGYNYSCANTPCPVSSDCVNCYSQNGGPYMGWDSTAVPLVMAQIDNYKKYLASKN